MLDKLLELFNIGEITTAQLNLELNYMMQFKNTEKIHLK